MIDLSVLPSGARVTVDTAPIIYLLEGHPEFSEQFVPFFEQVEVGEFLAVVSPITVAEVVAGPLKHGNEILADRYYKALTSSSHWQVQELSAEVSFMAARIRVRYGLKLPDAIQIATAIHTKSMALLTHDRDFSAVDEILILGI